MGNEYHLAETNKMTNALETFSSPAANQNPAVASIGGFHLFYCLYTIVGEGSW